MAARLPLLHKTPFVLDARPLLEATSPHAGVLSIPRASRALGLPQLIGANLSLRKRQRGFSEAQFIESISLLQAVGGECPEDMRLLHELVRQPGRVGRLGIRHSPRRRPHKVVSRLCRIFGDAGPKVG